ncbi:signal transduction histidine kinase [Aspergillus oryzae 100-8]|uniref:histidine kinase n=1 Tax=Aspergillus oryzae (strain 3.042) TaxID=1160506 RepID=I8I6P0_ASPO3|nr:signal transduction histidine kinase [Aspergillus oryzae 3.042]KDE75185.1 signal transduction histidine kinase [Aspergillus oryzae 100-8]|eukprot:EIT72431.1 signal transduction histidine kinase [Aspergillus oryzae 3.042]
MESNHRSDDHNTGRRVRSTGAASTVVPEEALVLGNPNTTLSSFAQLAALRLDVERVLISVSDRNSQFILAQSTRSTATSNKHEMSGDGVWSGCSTISTEAWKMCAATVALGPSKKEEGHCKFLVIDDLSQHDEYKGLSFVREKPNFRFYAGTPLTTETNINIGCLFILDTKPHDGLTDTDKQTMKTVSMLIMDYLRVSRQASEGRRAARLSRGLSCFVEGSSSFVDTSHPSYAGSFAAVPGTPQSSCLRANHLSVGSLNSFELPSRRSQSSDARSISSMSEGRGDSGLSPLPDWWSGNRGNQRLDEVHGNSWAFKRAANLLRESLELGDDGGVIFLEAGNTPMLDIESGSDCSTENSSPAPVLAISTNDEPFAPGPGSSNLYPASNFDSSFLHQLLRRYSKGKLWSFHRDGLVSSSDDEKPSRSRSRATKTSELGRGTGKKWKSLENSMLNLYFPNATQVLFVPLWNAANSQWFSGCFCWNTVETRVFNSSVELSSVLGFGSSIMAEYSRVESLISDRQKGDFIGSISHELRSPLHGILAAAEFLSGTKLDDFQGSLLETIDACGRTLLDTMNQVLDYSKIVSLEKSWRQIKRDKTVPSDYRALDRLSAHLDTYVSTDLALLTEEVVEGVCLGHAYGQKSTISSDQPVVVSPMEDPGDKGSLSHPRPEVDVVVNIAQNDWVYQTQPGALRRIIMNVFGNAMKYTDSGRVSVRLEVTEAEGRCRRSGMEELVTLVVSDTGKGISEEFLRGRLYTPFAQEDTLAVGTGLGLSIVRSLVKSLNGRINVNSTPGEGTTVKVTLPLLRPDVEDIAEDPLTPRSPSAKEKDSPTESRLLRDNHAGRRVAIAGVEPDEIAGHPWWSIISRYLTEWYGLELVSWSSQGPVDIVLSEGATSAADLKKQFATKVPALLLLCDKSVDRATKLKECSSLASIVNIIRPPCGPHKLARSIRKCFDSHANSIPTTKSIVLPERPKFIPDGKGGFESEFSDDVADLTPDATSSSGASSLLGSAHSPTHSEIPEILPTIMSPSSSVRDPSPSEIKEPESKPQRLARVLVVDDNAINLNLMLTFMKKRNLSTLDSAENGKVAVDAVERLQQGYDLIFMDISMPVMNGFEATRAIRAIEKERDCCTPATIIALTGLSSSRDESEALTSGVDLFLTKPVSFKEVSRLLEEWAENGLGNRCLSS